MDEPSPALHPSRPIDGAVPLMAALDLGTNNCRLLIARERDNRGFQIIDAFSRIVRLGEGLTQSGRLANQAMERTIEALKVCAEKIQRRHVDKVRAVATEACRQAENGLDFIARVRRETGLALEIISASEEAALAFRGTMPLLDPAIPFALIFDIGGGSTELGWIHLAKNRDPYIIAWHSLKVGVVTIAEKFGAEPATGQESMQFYESMVQFAADHLQPFARAIGAHRKIRQGEVQMLGTSGTVTTLTGISLNLPKYDRSRVDGSRLEFAILDKISKRLAKQTCQERALHPCIGPDRADLVLAGCAILTAICRQWPVGQLRVADRGVREGILMGLAGKR